MKSLAVLLTLCCSLAGASQAQASIKVTLVENGSKIDVSVSGSADVSAFTGGLNFSWGDYGQGPFFMLVGNGAVTRYDGFDVAGGFTGSNNTSGLTLVTGVSDYVGTMPPVGILPNGSEGDEFSGVYLPTGYAGETLSGTGSFTGDFASLGIVVGDVYSVSWESNGLQSIEFIAAPSSSSPVPEPATIAVWSLVGVFGVGCGVRRKMKKAV